jgi:hypothetical protein
MRRNNIIWGILLIFLGLLILINRIYGIDLISINYLWPLFILIPGLSFELGYFTRRRDSGLLVPGGILTIIGLLFLFQTYTNWKFAEIIWPICVISVAFGLFQLYIFGHRHFGLLIPVFILGCIGGIGLVSIIFGEFLPWLNYSLLLPIVFILLGIYILLKNY